MSRNRELIRELESEGWEFTVTGSNHLRGVHPNSATPLFVGSTPSDVRAMKNARATAR